MDALFKVWDLGWMVALIFGGAAVGVGAIGAMIVAGDRAAPSRARAAPIAGVVVALAALVLCSGVFTRVGRAPEQFVLVEHGGEHRLVALVQTSGRGGSMCTVRVHRSTDGRYLGGSSFMADCPGRLDGGALTIRVRPGLVLAGDLVRIDLWTGRSLGSVASAARAELGVKELRVHDVRGETARVELQDGTKRDVRVTPATTGNAVLFEGRADRSAVPGLFDGRAVGARCGGRMLVTHRSVAFGDGDDLLSAYDEVAAAPVWTIDRGRTVGSRVLGAFEEGGDCVVVGGLSGGRLAVARIGPTGAVRSLWSN